jgi:hypothetical protein
LKEEEGRRKKPAEGGGGDVGKCGVAKKAAAGSSTHFDLMNIQAALTGDEERRRRQRI